MSLSEETNKLKKTLGRMVRSHVKVQTVWAKAKTVDWANKKMVATGVVDELDYHDVLLGLGHEYKKPAVGTLCLLGIIENQEAASYLIYAEQVDETVYDGGENGGFVKVVELVERLNLVEKDLNDLRTALLTWTVSPNDGGAALRIALVGVAPTGPAVPGKWAAGTLTETTVSQIENPKMKH